MMNLNDFNTSQEIIPQKNPMRLNWIIAIDIGFSSVKGLSPNKRFCFPSYVKKIDRPLISANQEDIYYRDADGVFLVGTKAQDMVRSDDTNDTDLSFARNRYFTKDFIILARTAVAIGLMDNNERKNHPKVRPYIQTGLPTAYIKEDAVKIKSAFCQTGGYEIRLGTGNWIKFENDIKVSEVSVIPQPAGTLNSLMFNDNGEQNPESARILDKNFLIADVGFGTFDPYGVVNRNKVLEESINDLGMKKVLETAAQYILKDYQMDIRIPQMRKYMKDGYLKIVDIQHMSSKKVKLDSYIEKACEKVAKDAMSKMFELSNYLKDYDFLIVTGGTGAAWLDAFKSTLSEMDIEILPGNYGNELPIYYANARGYYMFAYRQSLRN